MDNLNFFKTFLEADDVPPDMVDASPGPDMPADGGNGTASNNDLGDMPDLPDDAPADDGGGDGGMPDMPDEPSDEEFQDDMGAEEEPQNDEDKLNNLGLDDKISAIMNMNLYQRYLQLLNTIGGQISTIRNNTDILFTISPTIPDIVDSLKKLDENIRLYLKNSFINENYSKNLLFFNKCLNLLKLLSDSFDKQIKKGLTQLN